MDLEAQIVTIEKWLCSHEEDRNRYIVIEATREYMDRFHIPEYRIELLGTYEVLLNGRRTN